MDKKYILGIDEGTSWVKVLIVDRDANQVGFGSKEVSTVLPRAGYVEQNPLVLWNLTHELIVKTLSNNRIEPKQIAAIGIANQRDTTVFWNRKTGIPYGDPFDLLVILTLSQHLWDYVDPITYARYVLASPLPGRETKRVLFQEARFDDQMPNLATRAVVRAIGLDLLEPSIEPVYKLTSKPGPLESAYVQYDTNPPVKPPITNIPAEKLSPQESPHFQLRTTGTCLEQIKRFLQPGGRVDHTCSGVCDPK